MFQWFDCVGHFVQQHRRAGIAERQDDAPVAVLVGAVGQLVLVPLDVSHGDVLEGQHRNVDIFGGIFFLLACRQIDDVHVLPVVVPDIPEVTFCVRDDTTGEELR